MLHFKYARHWSPFFLQKVRRAGVIFEDRAGLGPGEAPLVAALKARIAAVLRIIRARAPALDAFPILPQPLSPSLRH